MQPLGLKPGSSQTLGLLDVAASWEAFETINSCHVVLEIRPQKVKGSWTLVMVAIAWDVPPDQPAARLLGSERLVCWASEWRSLDTVAFRLLYALDARLALNEFGEPTKR